MFGIVPQRAVGAEGAAGRAQPHHAGDAAAARPRCADDDHRCGNRRQRGRTVPRDLRGRTRAQSRPCAGGSRRRRPRTSTSSWPRTCTWIMRADSRCAMPTGRVRPRFPRAPLCRPARRVGGRDAPARTKPRQLSCATTSCRSRTPACCELVDDDQTIMPGVRVQRTGGHTADHQMIWIESGGEASGLRRRSACRPLRTCLTRGSWASICIRWTSLAAKKAFEEEALAARR